jgi:hypothetical protein
VKNNGEKMKNKYSLGILLVMLALLLMGATMAASSNWWGMLPFLLGAYLAMGFRILKDSPRQAGLISVLGKKTSTKVEGLTLVFEPFGWRVISVVIFEIRKIDIPNFEVKNIRCSDGVIVSGIVDMQVMIDTSTGEQLKSFDDIGGAEGLTVLLPGMFETALQEVAAGIQGDQNNPPRDSDYMVKQVALVRQSVLAKLKLEEKRKKNQVLDLDRTDDCRETGCYAFKCVINLTKPANVQSAEQMSAVTRAMNARIEARMELYKSYRTNPSDPLPSVAEVRKELVGEDVGDKGLYQIIEGGNLVNFTGTGNGKGKP